MMLAEKIAAAARRYGVPEDLALRLARQESGIRHYRSDGSVIRSSAGALGVMQLMPATAAELGVDPYDEDQNIEGGIRYLRKMYQIFGNWNHAVAAYNAGPGRVQKVLRGEQSLPAETVTYVSAILGAPFQVVPGQPAPGASPPFSPGQARSRAGRPGRLS
jgi:soluble lytic murein transglycosylase-like protein